MQVMTPQPEEAAPRELRDPRRALRLTTQPQHLPQQRQSRSVLLAARRHLAEKYL